MARQRGERLWVIAYDVADDRRRVRLAAVLEAAAIRVQESVFEIRADSATMARLFAEATRVLNGEDHLRFYAIGAIDVASALVWGAGLPPLAGDYYLV